MAMEKHFVMRETHHKPITVLGYHPLRREILAGFEDGHIKSWDSETYKLVLTTHEHEGWVTDFLFWQEGKVMLSSSNDGSVIAWSNSGGVADRIKLGAPVYVMALNIRRHQLVCGFNAFIKVYSLDENRESGHFIKVRQPYISREHTDIVKCITCLESRVYSAGFDQRLIIYDSSSYPGHRGISKVFWLITGSFDKVVKIWSVDGKLTHRLDGFLATISDIVYVPDIKTVWVASGSPVATVYDPKSGENVSDFIGTFVSEENQKYQLQCMKYIPELGTVIASTNRRNVFVWRYNPFGCITSLKCKHAVESLTYTKKVPILIFNGGSDGQSNKWERLQSNHFMYSKETFLQAEAKTKLSQLKNAKQIRRKPLPNKIFLRNPNAPNANQYREERRGVTRSNEPHSNSALLKALFVEHLDLLLLGSEDGNIYVWGFDDNAVNALKNMKPVGLPDLVKKYGILLGQDAADHSSMFEENITLDTKADSVTNRVAGFVCKTVLQGHSGCVTCLTLVGKDAGFDRTYLLSSGWDRRICIWDLENQRLHDVFRNTSPDAQNVQELACDGIVIDMDFSPKRREFAYASSDRMIYIRRFSENGSEMTLCNTLQGDEGEITQIRWSHVCCSWITSSEDGILRVWSEDGLHCNQVIHTHGPIWALSTDLINGCIIAGVQNIIKVYNPETGKLVQTNIGHSDSVRSIVHIPERHQYVSGSWDGTLRVWNAYQRVQRKKKAAKSDVHERGDKPTYIVDDEGDTMT
ncbi:uncharacterized protein [Apostichopus japonicus]|uniref:uncharacterized protein isoform X2 n=1 Tax=Stichopus japonicus TaxID=307972 RepID=UPI003AB2907D